ncbi:DEDD exonuclease domain-containing protein [Salinibacter grassmerensis]|uniref:DEDD exonuclease domain-containing protein n=1 Tax=Salinibacter grassmerensis TaxID=3040353 RepID=UPI0021E79C80|nr:DEDD exonuclease domain-containing protein [Salinibacter grassmerensis]
MDIADATFVVTDLETTGTTPDDDRIMEIGAVKVQDGSVVDRFQQLVNPQQSVPGRITKMTGITTGMVFEAPPADEVLPDYHAFLGDGILVVHNASFDVSFLEAESRRIGDEAPSNETLCTVRLARRLLPGLDSKGLSRLAQFYDIDVEGRHRALGDAEATSVVLRRFVSQLAFEHEVETVEALLRFQHKSYQTVREVPGHIESIRDEVLPDVPDEPGVYVMKNRSGTPLYIGKAKRLPDRLRSHFTAVESSGARKRKMLQKVRSVDWTTTATELEAILLESRRIKAEKPRYNRAQRRYYNRPFIRLDTGHEYPTVSWTRRLEADGAEYYGPVRNTEQAEMVVDVVGRFFQLRECDDERLHLGQRCLYADMDRCTVPCEMEDPEAYATVVERVRAFLTGQDQSVLDTMQNRMQRASDDLDFEKAAELRDTMEQLERILEKQRVAAAPVRQHNAALVHQAPDRAGRVDVVLVRFGRFEESVACTVPLSPDERTHLLERCRSVFDAEADPPETFSKRDATEIRLLSHWVYAHRDDLMSIRWDATSSPEDMVESIVSAGLERVPRSPDE